MRVPVGPGVAAVAAVLLAGCSVSYVDEAGNRRIVGLVDVTVAADGEGAFAGNVVDVTTVGLAFGRNEQGGHVSLGYTRETVAALRDNVAVGGNPLGPRAVVAASADRFEKGKTE